ncbi:MAG TPA: ribokinase [Paucimonas sp.]|nr:ribokinase [Paucimonas sp.]
MNARIAVVGSVNMDLVFRTSRMPATGETIKGREFHQIPGGKGANQAVAAARQGAQVVFVASVGDDGFGEQSLRGFAAEEIDLRHIVKAAATPTGTAGILVDDSGHNCIVIAAGANDLLSPAQVDAASDAIGAAQLLVCQLETPMPTVARAIDVAKERGVKVILNPAPAQALDAGLLAKIDYLILNETEASQMSGIEVTDRASASRASEALLARGVGVVLLTMGEHGVCITQSGASRHLPAVKVDVVDTTAAGDTFVGAFAVGIARGLALDEAAMEAQYAAALTVTKLGAQTSIPRRAEVEQFMQSRKNLVAAQ